MRWFCSHTFAPATRLAEANVRSGVTCHGAELVELREQAQHFNPLADGLVREALHGLKQRQNGGVIRMLT
jgi:hypothetical protein